MNVFSLISIIAFMAYLIIGLCAFYIERRSKINQLFLAFCFSMSVWSFAYAFVYTGQDENGLWMKISAVGWCTFSSFILHLTLLFTESKIIRKTAVKFLLYIPSALFFYISVFLYREDAKPSIFIENFFNIGDFVYHFSFLLASIILILLWGSKSKSRRKRKQAKLIVVSSLIPFTLNLLTQTILPSFGIMIFPLMGHIYSLIMITGIFYTMVKYRLFAIAPKLLVEELLQEMMDIVILLSEEGRIIRINNYTEKLLGYTVKELQDKHLGLILQDGVVSELSNLSYSSGIYRLSEVYCRGKKGVDIPVSLSCSPVIDPYMKDVIGFVIVGQDISMVKQLEKEILDNKEAEEHILYLAYHDSLTELPNRKYFYEILKNTVNNANMEGKGFAVFFLDLDDLKYINDHFGHEAGDMVLYEVGKRSKASISGLDVVARIGGDEFTFLIFKIYNFEEAQAAADRIIDSVCQPLNICGEDININASIGFSMFPHDGNNADLLVKKADNEMYTVKRRNKELKNELEYIS